ncbi:MAG: hypothetical protein AAFP84_08280 [Actinomycetota bacterium]
MEPITWVFAAVTAVLVFAIAAGTIGREAHRLDAIAPRAAYQLDEAVDFVCDRLPEESQSRLTPEEVQQLLVFHMQWLHSQGLQPDQAVDQQQTIDDTVVVTEDALTAYLIGESERTGLDLLDDVDAVNVAEAHLDYFEAIGAIGPQAPLDDVI